jgi:hypothetical protein
METPSNISPWLHSLQLYGIGVGEESVLRIESTREKINSILDKIRGLEEKMWGLHHSTLLQNHRYYGVTTDIRAIRNAIGVYGIYHPNHSRRRNAPNMLWYKEELSFERTLPNKEGGCWLDYFGKDDRIRDIGGWIVVSLSHSGISYLNSIWEGVSSLSSSYITTATT